MTRHICGIWNGIWSDHFIESNLMRFGHSTGGIIRFTLKAKALKIWASSRHNCCKMELDMTYKHMPKIGLVSIRSLTGAWIVWTQRDIQTVALSISSVGS